MHTAFVRSLVILLATLTLTACGPQPAPFAAKTPAEVKQLADVTNGAVAVIRNPTDHAVLQQALAALQAASGQYEQHMAAIGKLENSDVLVCIRTHMMNVLDLDTMIAKLEEAQRLKDGVKMERRQAVLWLLAQDVGSCAATSPLILIDREKNPETIKHGAVLVAEIFAMAEIMRAASGLTATALLEDQISSYETVLKKLGPGQEVPGVTDALPELKATLALVKSRPAHNMPASGQLDQ